MSRSGKIEIPNLLDTTFVQIKRLSREACTKTDAELAEETRIKRSTIAAALSNPKYHPSIPNVPSICQALGNNLILEWPVAQIGGYIVFPPASKTEARLQDYIAKITKEFSDVLEQDARATMKDSPGRRQYTAMERSALLRELNQLEEKIEAAKMLLSETKKVARKA